MNHTSCLHIIKPKKIIVNWETHSCSRLYSPWLIICKPFFMDAILESHFLLENQTTHHFPPFPPNSRLWGEEGSWVVHFNDLLCWWHPYGKSLKLLTKLILHNAQIRGPTHPQYFLFWGLIYTSIKFWCL